MIRGWVARRPGTSAASHPGWWSAVDEPEGGRSGEAVEQPPAMVSAQPVDQQLVLVDVTVRCERADELAVALHLHGHRPH